MKKKDETKRKQNIICDKFQRILSYPDKRRNIIIIIDRSDSVALCIEAADSKYKTIKCKSLRQQQQKSPIIFYHHLEINHHPLSHCKFIFIAFYRSMILRDVTRFSMQRRTRSKCCCCWYCSTSNRTHSWIRMKLQNYWHSNGSAIDIFSSKYIGLQLKRFSNGKRVRKLFIAWAWLFDFYTHAHTNKSKEIYRIHFSRNDIGLYMSKINERKISKESNRSDKIGWWRPFRRTQFQASSLCSQRSFWRN